MAEEERLKLVSQVVDRFSTTLDRLQDGLLDVAEAQTLVDERMTINVDVDGLGQLTALNTELAALRGLQSGDLDVDIDTGGTKNRVFDTGGSVFEGLSDMEVASVLDMQSGFSTHVPTKVGGGGARAGGGGGATATGDGGGPTFLSREAIRKAAEDFGEAFSAESLTDERGRPTSRRQLLGTQLSKVFDIEGMVDAALDPKRKGITVDTVNEPLEIENFRTLRRRGFTNLPTSKGFLDKLPMAEGIQGLRAQQIHTLFARLIPLLATFIGAMPAAIAGLIALAGAAVSAAAGLAAVGGFAALGVGLKDGSFDIERLKDILKDLKDDFIDAFGPLAEQFAPLIGRAADGVERFFDMLAQRGDVLTALTDDALAFGSFLIDVGVEAILLMGRLAEAASGVFSLIGEGINMGALFGFLAETLADTIGPLSMFADAIADILPGLIRVSAGFLIFASMILKAIAFIGMLVDILPISAEALGVLVAGLLTYITVVGIASLATKALAGSMLLTAAKGIGGLLVGLAEAILGLLGFTATTATATIGVYAFAAALGLVLGLLTFGVLPAVIGAAGGFNIFGNNVASATKELKRFGRQSRRLSATDPRFGSGSAPQGTYVDVTQRNVVKVEGSGTEAGARAGKRARYEQSKRDQYFG